MEKVSIIIPCYNKEPYVKEAVKSALNQTYKNIEIICIDDCSTDNSRAVLKELAEKYDNITLIEEDKNIGVCRARNKAIEIASGEYILPLDADDTIEPTYIEKAINVFDGNPNIGVVYSRVRNLKNRKEILKGTNELNNLLHDNFITCSSVFKKSDFQKVGGYDTAFDKIGCEDWDLYLSFLEKGCNFYQIDEILFNYRQKTNKNRTAIQLKNRNAVYFSILIKHKSLYNKAFGNKAFETFFDSLRLNKKYRKYKNLFNIFVAVAIFETAIIIAYFAYKFSGGIL